MFRRCSYALVALLLVAAPLKAQTNFFGFDIDRFTPTNSLAAQSSFLASLSSFGTEDWVGATYAENQSMTYGAFGTGLMADPTFYPGFNTISNLVGLQGQDGRVTAGGGTAAAPISFTFSGAIVNGFGFFLSGTNDIGAGFPTVILDFLLGGSTVYSQSIDNINSSGGNTMFLGVSGLAFDRVDLRAQDGDGIWINDVTIGLTSTTVPEPSTFALLGIGMFGLGVGARRRMKA